MKNTKILITLTALSLGSYWLFQLQGSKDSGSPASGFLAERNEDGGSADTDAASGPAGRGPASQSEEVLSIEKQLSRQRIAGLSVEELTTIVSQSAPDGVVNEHSRFLWRATELLRVDSAACAALADIYQSGDAPSGRRELIADLLAQAGGPYAQKALVEVLQSSATESDPARVQLWQRLSFVAEPTSATLQAATQKMISSSGEDRLALTHTLGALAGHARDSGNAEAATQLHQLLEQELGAAQSPQDRLAALVGLGNARDPQDVSKFMELLNGAAGQEQGAAIRAIGRQHEHPEARRALASVIEAPDQAPEIKDTAIRTLAKRELSESEYQSLSVAAAGSERSGSTQVEISKALTARFDSENTPGWRSAVETAAANSEGAAAVQSQGLLFLDNLRR
jgi:hypothetical protein